MFLEEETEDFTEDITAGTLFLFCFIYMYIINFMQLLVSDKCFEN